MRRLEKVRSINSPIARGVVLGTVVGLFLSAIYGGGIVAFLSLLMTIRAPGTPVGDYLVQLAMASVTVTCAIPCVGLLGVAPGTIWGALLGLLIGATVTLLRKVLSSMSSALLGAAVSGLVALCWHLLFPFPTTTWIEVRTYLLYQGMPSLISLVAGGWMGWWLYRSIVSVAIQTTTA